jgi:hypothetical protein
LVSISKSTSHVVEPYRLGSPSMPFFRCYPTATLRSSDVRLEWSLQAVAHSTSASLESASEYNRRGLSSFSSAVVLDVLPTVSLQPRPTIRRGVVVPRDGEMLIRCPFPREWAHIAGGADAFHEVLVPFGEMNTCDRGVSVCLADTIRSQGFSPSQRLNPA